MRNVWLVVVALAGERWNALVTEVERQRGLSRWPQPENVELVAQRALARCPCEGTDPDHFDIDAFMARFDFNALVVHFRAHVGSAMKHVQLDEDKMRIGPCRAVRHLARTEEAALHTVAATEGTPDQEAEVQEVIERLINLIPKVPLALQAPMRYLLADYLGTPAPDYEELGVPKSTWFAQLALVKRNIAAVLVQFGLSPDAVHLRTGER
jgi:hypothetical protein